MGLPVESAASSSVESSAYSVSLSAAPAALPSALQSAASVSAYSVSLSAAPTALPYTKDFTVTAGPDETPYIVLAFNNNVTEDEIKNKLKVTKGGSVIDINWLAKDGEMDATKDINAMTIADMKKSPDDGKEYRLAVLRLKEGGTYTVNSGALKFTDEKSFAVEPFEKLELTQNGYALSGQVKYPVKNTTYVLRTYLGSAEGEATYLVDEQEVKDLNNISVNIPQSGALAPTGQYYVTSFLMTEKTFNMEDGTKKTALMGIDTNAFTTLVDYTNTNQPERPAGVTLEFVGNEVMRGEWQAVDGADGYRVTVYREKDDGSWEDTGFGYDLDEKTTAINMALTVGGAETAESKNLSANETYRIGVSAYRTIEGGKYYSAETQSSGQYLPEYTPLDITLDLGGVPLSRDENGVFHAYVRDEKPYLTYLYVTCDQTDDFTVTRMDTGAPAERDHVSPTDTFVIPDFTGTLMLKIDAVKGKDVTSVFLLVSRDETPPMLTLSDPVFFADRDTGEYTITGTADAGSEILYGKNGRTQAAGDGSFAIHDKLEGERETNASLYLRAKDSAGNESVPQLALITRQTQYAVTVNGSYDAQNSGAGSYAAGSVVTVRAGSRSGYTFNGWTSGSNVVFDDPSAAETIFTMPAGSVTVTANWSRDGGSSSSDRDDSGPRYAIGIPDKIENGSVSVSPKNASQGDRVTVTVKPDEGYELDSLKVFDKNGKELELTDKGDGKFTFIMPAGKVEVKAAFTEELKISPFRDVPTDAYYYEAVKWAQKKGITGGIGDGLFGPNQPCTRAQIVTFLWRAAGSPVVNYAMDLADVSGDAYYAEAVRWALSQGITTGTADGRFAPDATCTRAQGMTFLFRASKASADGAPAFSDVAADAYYAEAVKWATDNGITNGTTSSTFNPGSGCTRAQIVTFLWRLYAEK